MTGRSAFHIAYAMTLCFAYAMIDASPCICGRLRRASRTLSRVYDEALAPVGLTVTQFSVMRTLSRLDRPGLLELAETTAHEKSALWRTLQPLERKGWVAAETEPGVRGHPQPRAGAGWRLSRGELLERRDVDHVPSHLAGGRGRARH